MLEAGPEGEAHAVHEGLSTAANLLKRLLSEINSFDADAHASQDVGLF